MRLLLILLAAAFFVSTIQPSDGAKILALFVFPGKSHSNMLNAILRGLLAQGHELTVVTNFPLPANTPNYTHIDISPPFDIWGTVAKHYQLDTLFELHTMKPAQLSGMLDLISLPSTEHALRHPNFQRLMHQSSDQHFDLVLVEQFQQEALLMLAHQFRAPIVSAASFDAAQNFDDMFGVFGAWSHVPHERLLFTDHMSFWQRVETVRFSLLEYYKFHWDYMPKHQELADRYFDYLPEPRPTIAQLNRQISVLLMNGHAPLKSVRPTVPGLVDVGGLHIEDVQPLPADIGQFLDEAGPGGVIYFSLGTQLRSADMPDAQLEAFIGTFRQMPDVRVLWKWEDESLAARLPSNVLVRKWMPQNDILGHPKVRAFITHGGLLGTQEGVHHAVPMLGIPIYADQHLNMARAQLAGYAVTLTFGNVTADSLDWALRELLDNPEYATEVRRVSKIFRDRPERPLDRAVYWIEYVIRHKGAYHLRSAALDMSWFAYMLLDVVALGVAIVLVAVASVCLLVKKVLGLVKCSRQQSAAANGKKKL